MLPWWMVERSITATPRPRLAVGSAPLWQAEARDEPSCTPSPSTAHSRQQQQRACRLWNPDVVRETIHYRGRAMTAASVLTRAPMNAPTSAFGSTTTARLPVIQRACSCGGSAGISGKCAGCENEERLGRSLLQPKLAISSPGDPYEREADHIAD